MYYVKRRLMKKKAKDISGHKTNVALLLGLSCIDRRLPQEIFKTERLVG
jgi:hypothetical protein